MSVVALVVQIVSILEQEKMWAAEILGLLVCGCVTILVLQLIVVVRRSSRRRDENFPPGPRAWPLIGHLNLFISSALPLHQVLAAVSKKYGPIIGLRLGQQRTVVVSSSEAARQVLLTHDKLFADRPPFQVASLIHYGLQNGIAFAPDGPVWRRHRKIFTLHLRSPKHLQELEYMREQELRALLLSINARCRGGTAAIDFGECIGEMVSRLVMRFVQSSPAPEVGGENLHHLITEAERLASPTMGDLIPSLSCFDYFLKRRMRRLHDRIDKVLTQILMERKESASCHNDVLDSLLSQEDALTLDAIKSIMLDTIAGGIHTTALTLEWTLAELLRNSHCLRRLQIEIDTQLGDKKLVTDADLPKLSYLNCVIKEVFRLHPILPLLVPHHSLQECKIEGYIIPAKTLVLVNAWAIGRDERVWPNANEFRPERFEGSDMDVKGQDFELLPFGSGRRGCPGQLFALQTLHGTIANIVRCFEWELPNAKSHTSLNMDEKCGTTALRATPLTIVPKPRVPFLDE